MACDSPKDVCFVTRIEGERSDSRSQPLREIHMEIKECVHTKTHFLFSDLELRIDLKFQAIRFPVLPTVAHQSDGDMRGGAKVGRLAILEELGIDVRLDC
jgi:hypothetical protein